MTFEEMLALKKKGNIRKKSDNKEHRLQSACVRWFRHQYPKLSKVLFAIPNAARRSARNGAYMKEEGMLSGVADIILLKSNRFYGALAIEMKTDDGTQRHSQKEWQRECESAGNKYVICRSFEDFKREIENYIKDM